MGPGRATRNRPIVIISHPIATNTITTYRPASLRNSKPKISKKSHDQIRMANCDARRWERSIKKSFGYSKESSYGDVFNYPQLRFWLRIVKINFGLPPRIQSPAILTNCQFWQSHEDRHIVLFSVRKHIRASA